MAVKTTKDGRTILDGKDYTDFRHLMWVKQDRRCATCGWLTRLTAPLEAEDSFHVHHINGRGMGGGRRDDTFESCRGDCGHCHRTTHGQVKSGDKLHFSRPGPRRVEEDELAASV